MSEHFDHGPVQRYEVTWMTGHMETIPAHQVIWPQNGIRLFAGHMGFDAEAPGKARVLMHAEIDGHWRLTLSALEEDIRSIRLVTEPEPIPGGAS